VQVEAEKKETADVMPEAWHQRRDVLPAEGEYGGMTVSQAARLRTPEDANRRRKTPMADHGFPQASRLQAGRGQRVGMAI
jgi:hypothetical protein